MAVAIPFTCARYRYTWGPHEPALRIASGARLRIVCPDADNGQANGEPLPSDRRQAPTGSALFEGNPLAGPIYVEELAAGDALAVEVTAIELDRSYGLTLLAPAHGALSRDEVLGVEASVEEGLVPRRMYRWEILQDQGMARLANPLGDDRIEVPLRPMVGSLGVSPPWGQTTSSLFAGPFGGNLDLPMVKAGSLVVLPVFCDGGLLSLGDVHAAQGAGEIVGGGIETSGVVTIQVRRLANRSIPSPRIVVDDHMFAVAAGGDFRAAAASAYAWLLDWMAGELGMQRWDAVQLVSQTARLDVGRMATSSYTVAAGIAIERLPERCRRQLAVDYELGS